MSGENIHYVTGRQAGSLNTTNSAWKGTAKGSQATSLIRQPLTPVCLA